MTRVTFDKNKRDSNSCHMLMVRYGPGFNYFDPFDLHAAHEADVAVTPPYRSGD